MKQPEDFIRDIADIRLNNLQANLAWRDQWAGQTIDWDGAKIDYISQYAGAIHVNLTMPNGLKVIFIANIARGAELGCFNNGSYVRVSGVCESDLRASSPPYICWLREDARLSPGHDPSPPAEVAVEQLPASQQPSGCLGVLMCYAAIIISVIFFSAQ